MFSEHAMTNWGSSCKWGDPYLARYCSNWVCVARVGLRERILEGPERGFTRDLQTLQGRTSGRTAPPEVGAVNTPLVINEWRKCLAKHPDKEFMDYIIRGLEKVSGWVSGMGRVHTSPARSNMHSARERPEVIDDYLAREVGLGRVMGPLERKEFPDIHVSRFGLVPKGNQPDKWRLIVDLSHPSGASINDGIERELCSLRYTSVDEAVQQVLKRGEGALLAKFDVESAYRNVPVHPEDRPLLGMSWREGLYVDTALPFGLRSAPKIFTAVADALQWIMAEKGVESLHYLDDFILFGSPGSPECKRALEKALEICRRLGVPIAAHKTEGPVTVIVFWGIEIDAVVGMIRLPEEKLRRLQREIRVWRGRHVCTKRELLSLIGQLQHACCVEEPSWEGWFRWQRSPCFCITGYASTKGSSQTFSGGPASCQHGMGPAFSPDQSRRQSWGCGAFTEQGEWFQLVWPESWEEVHITVKELLPIVVGDALWGDRWVGRTVKCRCDNAAVVAVINSGRSKCDRVMHLMRCLFFFLAHFNVVLVGEHIPGVDNGAADALSRNRLPSFRLQVPHASEAQSPVPPRLFQALVVNQPDWTSRSWIELLRSIFPSGSQNPPSGRTAAPSRDSWRFAGGVAQGQSQRQNRFYVETCLF